MRWILLALIAIAVSRASPAVAQPAADGDTPGYAVRQMPHMANPPDAVGGRPQRGALQQHRAGAGRFQQRFQQANTSGDGRLTQSQARSGNMPMVAKRFNEIDVDHKGYITMDDVRAFRRRMTAQNKAAQSGGGPAPEGDAGGGEPGGPPQ